MSLSTRWLMVSFNWSDFLRDPKDNQVYLCGKVEMILTEPPVERCQEIFAKIPSRTSFCTSQKMFLMLALFTKVNQFTEQF